jgi:hypothetical protein
MELGHLCKEWTGEIHIYPIGQSIPLVTPPLMELIDGGLGVLVVHRDDLLARQIAGAVVEVKKVTEHETPLAAAGGALHGSRYIQRSVKFLLLWKKSECHAAVGTRSTHAWNGECGSMKRKNNLSTQIFFQALPPDKNHCYDDRPCFEYSQHKWQRDLPAPA